MHETQVLNIVADLCHVVDVRWLTAVTRYVEHKVCCDLYLKPGSFGFPVNVRWAYQLKHNFLIFGVKSYVLLLYLRTLRHGVNVLRPFVVA